MIKNIDMSEIYTNYMLLDVESAGKYIDEKCAEYNFSHTYFSTYLSRYVENLSDENKKAYKKKQKKVNFCKKEEVKYILNYINGIGSINDILLIGEKKLIISYLDRYLKLFPEHKQEILQVKEELDKLIMVNSDNLKDIAHELDNNMTIMLSLLACKNEMTAINQLNLFGFNKDIFYIYLEHFIEMFPNELEKIKYLKQLAEKYYSLDIPRKKVPHKVELIREVLLSGLSIEEYCSETGTLISIVNGALNVINEDYEIEAKEIKDILKSRNKEDLYNKIRLSVYQFLNNKEFNLLDYYEVTFFSSVDYLKICREVIQDTKVLRKITELIHKKIPVKRAQIIPDLFKKQAFLSKTIIGGKEVSDIEKQAAFDYIDQRNYPYDVYSIVLNKILKGTLSKQKVKE